MATVGGRRGWSAGSAAAVVKQEAERCLLSLVTKRALKPPWNDGSKVRLRYGGEVRSGDGKHRGNFQEAEQWEFPVDPVVRTPGFHDREKSLVGKLRSHKPACPLKKNADSEGKEE